MSPPGAAWYQWQTVIDRSAFLDVLDDLTACLEHWREEGVRSVDATAETVRSLAARAAPSPRAPAPVASAAPSRPAHPAAPAASMPRPAPTPAPARPAAVAAAPVFSCILQRLAELNDALPPARTRVRLLAEPSCFQGEPGELLAKMIRAAGYEITGTPALHAPGGEPVAALLVMGPAALLVVKPESIFNMIRGKIAIHGGTPMLVTLDPVFLEQNVSHKATVWQDLQKLLERLALPLPPWVKVKK